MDGVLGSRRAMGTARVGIVLGRTCRGRCQAYLTQRAGASGWEGKFCKKDRL